MTNTFHDDFVSLFSAHHDRLFRYLNRISGDPELAADLAQEAFMRLYRRGELPDEPAAWLITVAMNLLRNAKSAGARRGELLQRFRTDEIGERGAQSAGPAHLLDASELRDGVRRALDLLEERDKQMLVMRAGGYSYREIAHSLEINEASVGTLLARARRAFRDVYERTE